MLRVVDGVQGARTATGQVVVIDVIRAFTTAAYAFAAGIEEIELVSTVEEALSRPAFRMGEVGGRLVPGFDHNNSPSQLLGRRLSGRAVQRTGAGTPCVVAATGAEAIWIASLVVASATARAIAGAADVTLVISGAPEEGEEDRACAALLAGLLRGAPPSREEVVRAVLSSRAAGQFREGDADRPPMDLECCTSIDAFGFAMQVERREGRLLARPWRGA